MIIPVIRETLGATGGDFDRAAHRSLRRPNLLLNIDSGGGPTPAGEVCTSTDECLGDMLCLGDGQGSQVCTPRVGTDTSCSPANAYCLETDYCDMDSICRVKPGDGQPCGTDRFGSMRCAEDNECINGVCVLRTSGMPCASGGLACPEGEQCCTSTSCAARVCQRTLLPREACTEANTICHPGTACRGGICEPIDSQGLFEDYCAP